MKPFGTHYSVIYIIVDCQKPSGLIWYIDTTTLERKSPLEEPVISSSIHVHTNLSIMCGR